MIRFQTSLLPADLHDYPDFWSLSTMLDFHRKISTYCLCTGRKCRRYLRQTLEQALQSSIHLILFRVYAVTGPTFIESNPSDDRDR